VGPVYFRALQVVGNLTETLKAVGGRYGSAAVAYVWLRPECWTFAAFGRR
jgi:hypothetical protein